MKRISALLLVLVMTAALLCGCEYKGGSVTLAPSDTSAVSEENSAAELSGTASSDIFDTDSSVLKTLTETSWYNSEDISQEWIFSDDGTLSVNGKSSEYSLRQTLLEGQSLVIDGKAYSFYIWYDGSMTLYGRDERIELYSAESDEYKRIVGEKRASEECSELLDRYPDSDGWMQYKDFGDIPFLADADYIEKSLNEGAFMVNTPEELASAVWAVNTVSEGYFAIVLEADIDLSGYEWAPMGWNGGAQNHPFNGAFLGSGHTIKNMTINSSDTDVGFIGWETFCYAGDVTFDGASVCGGCNVGVVSGQAIGGVYEGITIINSTVDGSTAGSMLGWDANTSKKNCSADVVVNGEKFGFLSYNDKAKSEIVIDDPVEITIDEQTHEVTRPEVEGYYNLGWMVFYNGEQVLHRNAENELSYTYFLTSPGYYEIYLTAYVEGQYVPISNTVSYTIE